MSSSMNLPPAAKIAPGTQLDVGACDLSVKSAVTISGNGHRLAIGDFTTGIFRIRVSGRNCAVEIGPGCAAKAPVEIVLLRGPSRLSLGAGTTFRGPTKLFLHEASEMLIGEDCMFSGNIAMATSDAHPIYDGQRARINPAQPIVLGRHVWVGADATILKGARIGAGCVVARGTIVTAGTYPERAILAGAPARVVREDVYWERSFARDEAE